MVAMSTFVTLHTLIVFVNSKPDAFESPTSDPCEDEEFELVTSDPCEDEGFELVTADTGCGEQFKAPDLSHVISKLETSAIAKDDEDVDETGMFPRYIDLVIHDTGWGLKS
ncbi:hypothetical protein AQUCO_05500097v1 [Aquilegia coerulea]|uniref:Uncharacterized protein n=1 Tax=Aquilegia coerulea TaxID=218851 RepID=A0A2G5CH02_AQUCA|nr:hypothetical protein AQUCO_05500097v1 [Aquilegia coerulea]